MSKLEEATQLVEKAADSAGKIVEKAEKVAKIAKEAWIGRAKQAAPSNGGKATPGNAAGTQGEMGQAFIARFVSRIPGLKVNMR